MAKSIIKNSRKVHAGPSTDPSLDNRVYYLENNVYKITYYEIVSGASGTLTVPSQATINSDEFGLSGNALLSKVDISNKPTYESPLTLGGTVVTASLNTVTGAWAVSGAYTDLNVALIYSIEIKAEYFSNLNTFYIIETANLKVRGTQTLQDVTDLGNVTTHPIEADYFVTTGGTSSEFVKGDGSLDNTSYLTSVGATAPITSSGGSTPTISTSMNTNKLIGRSTSGVGVMEEISLGTGLTLSSGTLSTTPNNGITHATTSGTDTYTTSITGVTSYADGDCYLIRFPNGNTTTCTLNINGLGAISLYRNNDGPLIGGDIEAGAEMLCVYNSTANTFQCIGTSPNSIIAYVTNADSVTITKGQPVYAFGGTGDRMTVKLANNTGDSTSAQTVGLVMSTSIAANQKGFIMMQGLLDGLSILPTATWTDGDPVYLGATAGTITNVKPYAPNHLVYLGFVTTASNGSAGRMYVRVQNGYELDELHNVQAQSPNNNDTIYYDSGVNQWKTASLATILGYTPVPNTRNLTINGTTYDLSADRTWTISTASNVAIKDEGSTLTSAVTSIDFTGSAVTATAVGNDVTVNINAGGAASFALFNYYNFI